MGLINRGEIANRINSDVRSGLYYDYQWYSSNKPHADYPNIFASSLSSISASDINGSNPMDDSGVINSIMNFAYNYFSVVRNIRYIHRYTGEKTDVISDTTKKALLNSSYRTSISTPSMGIYQGQTITRPNFSSLLSNIRSSGASVAYTWTSTQYAQYSQTAHSSRGRR